MDICTCLTLCVIWRTVELWQNFHWETSRVSSRQLLSISVCWMHASCTVRRCEGEYGLLPRETKYHKAVLHLTCEKQNSDRRKPGVKAGWSSDDMKRPVQKNRLGLEFMFSLEQWTLHLELQNESIASVMDVCLFCTWLPAAFFLFIWLILCCALQQNHDKDYLLYTSSSHTDSTKYWEETYLANPIKSSWLVFM